MHAGKHFTAPMLSIGKSISRVFLSFDKANMCERHTEPSAWFMHELSPSPMTPLTLHFLQCSESRKTHNISQRCRTHRDGFRNVHQRLPDRQYRTRPQQLPILLCFCSSYAAPNPTGTRFYTSQIHRTPLLTRQRLYGACAPICASGMTRFLQLSQNVFAKCSNWSCNTAMCTALLQVSGRLS